jgi:hypothetical protein
MSIMLAGLWFEILTRHVPNKKQRFPLRVRLCNNSDTDTRFVAPRKSPDQTTEGSVPAIPRR